MLLRIPVYIFVRHMRTIPYQYTNVYTIRWLILENPRRI